MQTRLDFIIGNLVQALQLIARDPQKVFSSLYLMTSDERTIKAQSGLDPLLEIYQQRSVIHNDKIPTNARIGLSPKTFRDNPDPDDEPGWQILDPLRALLG